MNEGRLQRLQAKAVEEGLYALAVMPGPNLRYLSGMDMMLSERPALLLVPAAGEPVAACPAFEAARVEEATGVARVFGYTDEEGPRGAMDRALRALPEPRPAFGGRRVWGLEYRQMRLLEREWLAEAWRDLGHDLTYVDAGRVFAALRMRKDEAETAALLRAAAQVDEGMTLAREAIRPGVSELTVAAAIADGLRRLGVRAEPEILVASGPRAAVPHAGASERVMQDGELCWVDLVVTHEDYVGDITRTFAVGDPERVPEVLRRAYRVVEGAQAAARAAARPGLTGAQVDAAAREPIAAGGFGPNFSHRTGHGIGLDVHEEPYMVAGADMPLEAGMAFTIEPGIYLPGIGGVRIEDDVILIPGGARVLTAYPRGLSGPTAPQSR